MELIRAGENPEVCPVGSGEECRMCGMGLDLGVQVDRGAVSFAA